MSSSTTEGSLPIRDFVGYGGKSPIDHWPNRARVAINFVLNVEESSEPSVPDGDGYTENRLTDSTVNLGNDRDLAAEGLFEYGSRAGFWRIHREFQRRKIPLTIFACAVALERNPLITEAIIDAGYDVCSHGYRWVNHRVLDEASEREQIALAVSSFQQTLGKQPEGWYCRYGPSPNTRKLLIEQKGFVYDSDAYNDDLPYWVQQGTQRHLVVPYSLVSNDAKMMTMPSREWAEFINDGIDALARDEETQPAMVSIGLHCRIVGHPNRFAGLLRVLDHVVKLPNVWIASRLDIAQYWSEVNGR